MRKLRAADLFCGAGGTTAGAVMSGAVDVKFALNHWSVAIETHSANHPTTKHVNSRLEMTSPAECGPIDLLFASPECTHHSIARGGRPTTDQQRSGAWDVMKWVEFHRPSYICIENVIEFKQWGPIGNNGRPMTSKKGKFFDVWLMAIREAGYRVECLELNAADFGAATSRKRLFVIARKGSRQPILPEPVRSQSGAVLPSWRSAAEVIDWTIPIGSIFTRKVPLAEKTLKRLEAGLRKFVMPFVVKFKGEQNGEAIGRPLTTITAGGKSHGLAIPFRLDINHAVDGHRNGRTNDVATPFGAVTTKRGQALALPFIAKQYGTKNGTYNPNSSLCDPLGTVTTIDHNGLAVPFQYQLIGNGAGRSRGVDATLPTIIAKRQTHGIAIPWVSSFYGTNNHHGTDEPIATITTKDRHAVCVAVCRGPSDWPSPQTEAMQSLQRTMRELGVDDLLFRMFQNHELAAAQGFPQEYYFAGTKADVTKQIGNSVSPPVAKAISLAVAG